MEISLRRALAPLVACLLAGAAQAAPPPPRVAVFAGVERAGASDAGVAKIVRRRLERTGEVVRAPEPPLSPAERACSAVDCLAPLAAARSERRLWGVELGPSGAPGQIRVWVYDAPSRRLLESTRRCAGCDDQSVVSAILATRLTLLEHLSLPESEAAPPSPALPTVTLTPPPPPPPPAAPPPPPSFWDTPRGRAATALIPLLAATLTTSIVLSALHGAGQETCLVSRGDDGSATTRCNDGLLLGLGYGASAALAGGLLLTFTLPRGR